MDPVGKDRCFLRTKNLQKPNTLDLRNWSPTPHPFREMLKSGLVGPAFEIFQVLLPQDLASYITPSQESSQRSFESLISITDTLRTSVTLNARAGLLSLEEEKRQLIYHDWLNAFCKASFMS